MREAAGVDLRKPSAVLPGHRRYAIRGQVFPGAVAATPADAVPGRLLLDITPAEVAALDAFEGEEYDKVSVAALATDTTPPTPVRADVYLWTDALRPALHGEWDYEAWREKDLERYRAMVSEFAEEVRAGDAASAAAREGGGDTIL